MFKELKKNTKIYYYIILDLFIIVVQQGVKEKFPSPIYNFVISPLNLFNSFP